MNSNAEHWLKENADKGQRTITQHQCASDALTEV